MGADGLDVATRLWLYPQANFSISNAWLLVPGIWVVWCSLGCSHGWLLRVPWLWACLFV